MKIHIFGASGTGVSTLGQALAENINLPYFDSDDFFWENTNPPFTQRRAAKLRNQLIQNELKQSENWILGGSIINWGAEVFPPFDLIVFLWIPSPIRLSRLKQRELERYGDVIFTDAERNKQFNEFMLWAADYDQATGIANRTIQAHQAWLAQQNVPILRIEGDYTTAERLTMVLAEIKSLGIKKEK